MAKPTLQIIKSRPGMSSGKCSECDLGFDAINAKELREQFNEHVQEKHSGEDVNQAAARIVREATGH